MIPCCSTATTTATVQSALGRGAYVRNVTYANVTIEDFRTHAIQALVIAL